MKRIFALTALAALSSCTLVKPVVCTFSYPIDSLRTRLASPDDDVSAHERTPPVLAALSLPLLVPLRFCSDALIGGVAGLFSGIASDLNVITWNFDEPAHNLTRPFRTNAKKPRE